MRPRRSALEAFNPPKPSAEALANAEARGYIPVGLRKAPEIIEVPNHERYTTVEGDTFLMWGSQCLDEGWKLHVPLTDSGHLRPPALVEFERQGQTYKLQAKKYYELSPEERRGDRLCHTFGYSGYADTFKWLQSNNVVHKFVPSLSKFRANELKEGGQGRGKFLTIYTDGPKQLHEIISNLDKLLRLMDMEGCFTCVKQDLGNKKQEKPVGSLFLIRARYGSYTDDYVLKPGAIAKDLDISDPLCCEPWVLGMKDDRDGGYKPKHIADPFGSNFGQGGKDSGWYNHPWSTACGVLECRDSNVRPLYEYDKDSKKFDTRRRRVDNSLAPKKRGGGGQPK